MSNSILNYLPLAKQKTAHEYAAPCPSCGGTDRFTVWPDRARGGAYMCRGCSAQGDGIEFLKQFHGMAYVDACRALGMEPNTKPVGSRGTSFPARQKPPQATQSPTHPTQTPPQATLSPPPSQWRTKAAQFLLTCQSDLYSINAIKAITGRYLCPDTALACGLGYNAHNRYELRTAWGLDPIQDTNGKRRDKILLPAGLVIATRRKSGIMALTIRRADWHKEDTRPKYWQVQGSSNPPYAIGKQGLPIVLLESALDACLLHQEAGDLCAAVAFMGATKGIDQDTAAFIKQAPLVLCCPDYDQGGRTAWQKWKQAFPLAVVVPPIGAKDIGDMHKAAMTFDENLNLDMTTPTCREWVQAALSIAKP